MVMLNVLIAVISDTFDRLLERSESSFVKSLTQLIAEIESIFGPWDPPAFTPYSRIKDGAQDEWAGRVGALKAKIAESQSTTEARLLKMEGKIDELRSEMKDGLKKMEAMFVSLAGLQVGAAAPSHGLFPI